MCKTQSVLASLVLCVGLAHSWDIAVGAGDELSFYTKDTITSTIRLNSQNLRALAYVEVQNMMLYVDKQTNNDAICGYYLSSIEIKCFIERNGRNIHGIAFDPATDTVFFTDTNERSVNWISLKPGSVNNANGNLLIKMDAGVPRDIIVDSCKGYVYWINTNLTKPTIERARINGSEREVFENITSLPFNTTHNLEPHSLAYNQQRQAIMWLEPVKTNEYRLFISKLDRTRKTFLLRYPKLCKPCHNHPPNTLAVSKQSLFSVEFCTEERRFYNVSWTFPTVTKYIFTLLDKKIPIGIVANYKIADQIEEQDCEAFKSRLTTAPECDGPFCVHGMKVNGQSVCKCAPGYTGERCDVSVCENYCLQGICRITDAGLPKCRCDAGYSGVRCEVYACHGYCHNDGDCSLNEVDEPVCRCDGSYEGTRCEGYTQGNLTNNFTTCSLVVKILCDPAKRKET